MMGIFSTTSLKTVARLLIALALLASSAIAQAQSMSDAGSCRADVVFLMDNTGSMGGPISNTKRNASTILDAISGGDARFAGIDTRSAVATYWGDPREHIPGSGIYYCHRATCPWSWCSRYYCENPSGRCHSWYPRECSSAEPTEAEKTRAAQRAFKINQALTDSKALVKRGMNQWRPCSSPGGCGGDWAEANFFALHQLATGGGQTDGKCIDPLYTGATCSDKGYSTGYDVGWRDDAGRIVLWFGDACSWSTTVDKSEVNAALLANNVIVAGINTYSAGRGIDYRADTNRGSCLYNRTDPGQATLVTGATSGTLTNNVSGTVATINAVLEAVAGGIAQSGSAAAVSFSTGSLTEGSQLYQSKFNAKDWSGDLVAYELGSDGSLGSQAWSAANRLDATTPGSRVMMTLGAQRGVAVGTPFRWSAITSIQKNDLRTEPNSSRGNVSKGTARLEYLRGDRSNEGKGFGFRVRGSALGDIWHSSAIYVGKPGQSWPDSGGGFPDGSNKYSVFSSTQSARTPVVYVGANDGFLHGFRASDGKEVLAYAPSTLFSTSISAGYHRLTDPNFNHNNLYVDGTPTVSDAFFAGPSTKTQTWHTVLAGTLGGGGRGLFALDVTNPSAFRESNAAKTVLWEFTNATDAHLGYTYSRPTIALMNNGRWALITGNGLEDTATDSTGGDAQLFVIYLDGGVDGTWTYGTDYIRITTGSGSTSSRNGLFSPAVVDLDRNGTADRIYAGDLNGSLWAFDVSNSIDTKWSPAHGRQPLFTGSSGQSITTKPTVIRHPTVSNGSAPNLMVLFGTGRFLADGDKTRSNTQSFYGIWDNGTGALTRSSLASQTFLLNDSGKRARVLDPYLKVKYEKKTGRQYGWYIDLPAKGERVVSEALVRGKIVYFNSIIPDVSVCASGGSGWEMSVKTENGGSPDAPVFDFNEDGAVTVSGDTTSVSGRGGSTGEEQTAYAGKKLEEEQGMPAGPSIIGNRRFTPASATDEGVEMEETLLITNDATVTGRLSWEQLFPD